MSAQDYQAPASVNRVQTGGLIVGGIALVLAIFGAVHRRKSSITPICSVICGYWA